MMNDVSTGYYEFKWSKNNKVSKNIWELQENFHQAWQNNSHFVSLPQAKLH